MKQHYFSLIEMRNRGEEGTKKIKTKKSTLKVRQSEGRGINSLARGVSVMARAG